MILSVLLVAAATAFADAPKKAAGPPPEETLRVKLAKLRRDHIGEMRQAMFGGAEKLRDAVATSSGAEKERLADRLPGMARDPFDLCRDLRACREAPQSMHVEDNALVDDALVALARPWFKLQEARGKSVKVTVDPGTGVRLDLEDFPKRPVITLGAAPTDTGGFDVTVDDGAEAAKVYAAERAAVLAPK